MVLVFGCWFFWFFFFFQQLIKLKSTKMPHCQPEVLKIWPHGLYQVKDCSYTRSSLFLRCLG